MDARTTLSPIDDKNKIDIAHCVDNALDDREKQIYQSIVGALLYAALGTRPDIAFAVSALSRHCAHPISSNLTAARRVLQYLYTTRSFKLLYSASDNSGALLNGFCNADWASSVIDRRSISGFVFRFGNSLITWKLKRQTMVALSTAEAELIACSEASREAMWLKRLLHELVSGTSIDLPGFSDPINLFCNNQSALKSIAMGTTNPSSRNKHIDIKHYHARDMKEFGFITFSYVNTVDNLADVFTKGLPVKRHQELMKKMALMEGFPAHE